MTDSTARRPGFWARQFAPRATPTQHAFDVAFGIVLPLVCLWLDPIVFKSSLGMGGAFLGRYAAPAWLFIGGAILALAFWISTRRLSLILAGPFLAAALIALGLGTVLLPFSLPLALVGIGLLGLVPLGTAFTFLRSGVRAVRMARPRVSGAVLSWTIFLTGALAVGVPVGAHVFVQRRLASAVVAATSDDGARRDAGLARLRRYGALVPGSEWLDGLVFDWNAESDPVRQARLAAAYHAATGRDVRDRWYELAD